MTDERRDDEHTEDGAARRRLSRRGFLGGLGIAGAGVVASACSSDREETQSAPVRDPEVRPDSAVPADANRDALQFLNPHQARTVDAIVARLIPGDAESPGAREAGVVYYIDHLLAAHTGYAEPAYMQGPFAMTYEGDEPPEEDGDAIWVQAGELERYGRQSAFVPREIYRMGLARLDQLSGSRFDGDFIGLTDAQRDELLAAVEDDQDDDVTDAFGELAAGYFFQVVRGHTLQGFFADPVYGGNRDMVGWRLIGFPGSRRSYSPRDIFNEEYDVTPQSLLDLPPFNADHDAGHADVLPAVRQRHPNGPID